MSTLELYICENRVIEVVMFRVSSTQIGIKLAGVEKYFMKLRKIFDFVSKFSNSPRNIRNSSGTMLAFCRLLLLESTKTWMVLAMFSDRVLILSWYSRKSTTYLIRTLMLLDICS